MSVKIFLSILQGAENEFTATTSLEESIELQHGKRKEDVPQVRSLLFDFTFIYFLDRFRTRFRDNWRYFVSRIPRGKIKNI